MRSHRHAPRPRYSVKGRWVIVNRARRHLASCRCHAWREEIRDGKGRLLCAGPWKPARVLAMKRR